MPLGLLLKPDILVHNTLKPLPVLIFQIALDQFFITRPGPDTPLKHSPLIRHANRLNLTKIDINDLTGLSSDKTIFHGQSIDHFILIDMIFFYNDIDLQYNLTRHFLKKSLIL